ncbi:hypothetical protein OIU77_010633, partial [Salix suchowensis]
MSSSRSEHLCNFCLKNLHLPSVIGSSEQEGFLVVMVDSIPESSSGDQISTGSKYHAVLTSLVVLEFMLIGKMATYYCDHQN